MNQREFYERIYNYKHGIKETNDTIQHSAKGLGEGGEHIAHYELGQEADPSKRKYIDKIYLGEGKYRYVYDDGTSSTGYKPLDVNDPVRQKQRAQQTANTAQGISQKLANDAQAVNGKKEAQEAQTSGTIGSSSYTPPEAQSKPIPYAQLAREQEQGKITEAQMKANGTPSTASQIGSFLKDNVGTQSPSNPDFSQARKESYAAEGYDKAPKSAPIPYAKLDAQAKEGEKMAALYGGTGGQVKPNTGTLGSGVASDTAKQTTAPNFSKGLTENLNQTSLPDTAKNTDYTGAPGANTVEKIQNPALSDTSQQATDISSFLKENVQNPTNPEYTAPQGTPYSELQSKSVNATRDNQARKIVDDYLWQLEEDVYDPLKRAGWTEEQIWGVIDSMESSLAGEAISKQLAYMPNDTNVMFFPGAEDGLQVYLDQVLPVLKNIAVNAGK